MSNLVFPLASLPGVKINVKRRPIWKTTVQEAISGKELRAAWWSFPRYRYTLSFEGLRTGTAYQEFQTLVGFIGRHLGQFDSFLFQDPDDQSVTAHAFGKGNGSTTAFQLQRSLVPGAQLPADASKTYWPASGDGFEPVFDLNGAPSIYVGGVLKATPADYAINSAGLVTFTTAPANNAILTWTGNFYRRVRLASDEQDFERVVLQWWKQETLELISVK